MDYITGIQHAIDYIEANITEELDYEKIAALSYTSSYHFQRVFSILCGYTLGEYIRCRRLSLVGAELADRKIKVVDAAVKYGYDSPDSFAKAFTKFHGITPSAAREPGMIIRSFARLSIKLTLEGGTMLNYRIVEMPATVFTGYKRHFTGVPGERHEQEKDFYTHTRPNQYLLGGLADDPFTEYNIIANVSDSGYDFYIAQPLNESIRKRLYEDCILGEEDAKRFEHFEVPAHTYAVFETDRCRYPTTIDLELRRRIVSEWLPSSDYIMSDMPEIVVGHWYRIGDDRNKRYRELWIPIEKK